MTSHGKPDHVVSGSCRAFLELLGNAAGAPAAGLSEGAAERQSFVAKVKAGPRLYDIENCQRPTKPIHPGCRNRGTARGLPARRHCARRFRRASRFRRPLLERLRAAHLYLGDQSRTDGLGHSGGRRRAMRAAQAARRRDHRRRLHADARHGGADRGALSPADHLCRAQQPGAGQCLAARASSMAPLPAELTTIPDHDWAGFARSLGAQGMTVRRSRGACRGFHAGARDGHDRADRCESRQGLPDAGLRFHRRRAGLVLSRIGERR